MGFSGMKQLPLAICIGDPAGVGPEVIEAALTADSQNGVDCCLVGPREWCEALAEELNLSFVSVGSDMFSAISGNPTIEGAEVALEAMQVAARGCQTGRFRGVVTGPVSKYWLKRIGFLWPGQTEFFADAWQGVPTMGFLGDSLRVVLATWHIPLRAVSDALTPAVLETAVWRADSLARDLGCESPRIGVCGINPHAGENGIIGKEERDILDPTLDRLRNKIPGLSKCLPGDTVFFRQAKGEFDVVVAAYHDQGLAAVKTLEFDSAVNVTLGLEYIRTSPDHGTAYELAGLGRASHRSMLCALNAARRLTSSEG